MISLLQIKIFHFFPLYRWYAYHQPISTCYNCPSPILTHPKTTKGTTNYQRLPSSEPSLYSGLLAPIASSNVTHKLVAYTPATLCIMKISSMSYFCFVSNPLDHRNYLDPYFFFLSDCILVKL